MYRTRMRFPPPGAMVDVGGFRLHMNCSGIGSPAVILDAALGGSSISWTLVQPELSKSTRVCSYDRAGFGWSDPGPVPRTAGRIATELRTLLEKAAVAPPYILVGHSYGGLVMRVFAARYRPDVAALILVDPAHPEDWVQPAPKEQVKIERGIRLCRLGSSAARSGLARFVAAVANIGAFGLALLLARIISRGGLSREDEGILAPAWRLPRDARKPLRQFWTQPKFFDALGSQIEHICQSATETLDAGGRRLRRPAARHHLVNRPRRLPDAAAGGARQALDARPSYRRIQQRPLDSAGRAAGRHRRHLADAGRRATHLLTCYVRRADVRRAGCHVRRAYVLRPTCDVLACHVLTCSRATCTQRNPRARRLTSRHARRPENRLPLPSTVADVHRRGPDRSGARHRLRHGHLLRRGRRRPPRAAVRRARSARRRCSSTTRCGP